MPKFVKFSYLYPIYPVTYINNIFLSYGIGNGVKVKENFSIPSDLRTKVIFIQIDVDRALKIC